MSIKNHFLKGIKERMQGGVENLKNKTRVAINNSEEVIGTKSAEWAMEAADHVVEELKKDAAPMIEQTAQSLSPEETDTWNILREKIAPAGGFFNTLFARLLWFGSKVSSFVGALVVDQWTGNNEKEKNVTNLDVIFSWMLGSMFKKEKATI